MASNFKNYALFALVLVADQVTKSIARTNLVEGDPISFLSGHLKFFLVHNTGAFLSLGASWPYHVRLVVLILFVIFLLYFLWRMMTHSSTDVKHKICYALVLGGGMGNLIDRLYLGEVTDFVWIGFGPLQTGVFNIADMAILFGVIYLILEPLFFKLIGLKVHSKNN